ncbi:MAG: PEP/pyruvate-binding domain-containing protein [bacterium]
MTFPHHDIFFIFRVFNKLPLPETYFFLAFFVPSFVLVVSALFYFLIYFALVTAVAALLNALSILQTLPLYLKITIALTVVGIGFTTVKHLQKRQPRGLTAKLSRLSSQQHDLYGGKAASLGELARAKLPIPYGFAVSCKLFEHFTRHNRITPPDTSNLPPEKLNDLYQETTAEIRRGRFPILPCLRLYIVYLSFILRSGADASLIVRSSFGGEDTREHLAPGQYISIRCSGFGNLLNAVRECWCSFWSESATQYRIHIGIPHEPRLSLIIQLFLPPEIIGAAAAANPATGFREEFVIDITTSPQYSPLSPEYAAKDITETVLINIAIDFPHIPHNEKLPLLQNIVNNLRSLSLRLEYVPVVEWLISNGHLYFLQLRPLTALPPVSTFIATGMIETPHEPLSPMTVSLITSVRPLDSIITAPLEKYIKTQFPSGLLKKINCHFYADFITISRVIVSLRPTFLQFLKFIDLSIRQAPSARQFLYVFNNFITGIEQQNLAAHPTDQLINTLKTLNTQMQGEGMMHQTTAAHLFQTLSYLFEQMMTAIGVPRNASRSLPVYRLDCIVLERNRSLNQLLSALRHEYTSGENPKGRPAGIRAAELWDEYLRRFGFLAPGDRIDLSIARIGESGEIFAGALQPLVASPPPPAAAVSQPKLTSLSWQHKGHNIVPWDFLVFWFLYNRIKTYATLREEVKYALLRGWSLARRLLLEIARRQPFVKILQVPDEIFFLEIDELTSIAEEDGLKAKIAARRQDFTSAKATVAKSIIHLSQDGKIIDSAPAAEQKTPASDIYYGIPASPGVCDGTIKRISEMADAEKVEQGDIALVDRCEPWMSVLLNRACGIIALSGGVVSHLALAAREYGVPMLIGAHSLHGVQIEGRRATINTSDGTVKLTQ